MEWVSYKSENKRGNLSDEKPKRLQRLSADEKMSLKLL